MTSDTKTAVASGQALPQMEDTPSRSGFMNTVQKTLSTWPARTFALILLVLILAAIAAPLLATHDPLAIDPAKRLHGMSDNFWLGSDAYGRDVYSRLLFGARVSLIVGAGTVVLAIVIGMFIGVMAGYFRWVDVIVMRVMDGLMAIPGILLAIALIAVTGATVQTVLIAIAVPEIPRVVRMTRSVILSVRSEPYVEAAQCLGTKLPAMVWRHMVPNTLAPLLVQGTYIFASAILTESILSFLGAGVPPEIPSWGNMMADGRIYFLLKPELILYPGLLVSLTVLSVNMLGDVLRDTLDPRMAKRL